MRVISLIPSITETLVECGVNLVGRSRFCIHPAEAVARIPAVAGTKQADWSAMMDLKPDLVVLDREENTLEMARSCPFPYLALHITAVEDVAPEFRRLAERLTSPELAEVAERWRVASERPARVTDMGSLPGIMEWWREPVNQSQLVYLIWRNPWMAIGQGTFIHSMLCRMGMEDHLVAYADKYPKVELEGLDPKNTALLFSSEPFPFQRYREELMALGYACALVDGEWYSWYGTRSLRFLETGTA